MSCHSIGLHLGSGLRVFDSQVALFRGGGEASTQLVEYRRIEGLTPTADLFPRPLVTRLALFYALLSRQVQQLCLALDSRRPNVCDELTIFLIPPLYKLSVQLETDPL